MLSWGHWCHHADDQSDPQGAFWTSCSPVFVFIILIAIGCFIISHQDLSSPNQYDTGVALTGLSCFVTPDLARDLANDIMTLVKPFRLFTSDKYWHSARIHSLSPFIHLRCPTLSHTFARRRCWSCTKCSWSTPSPCVLPSHGSKRSWRTQIPVWMPNHHLNVAR